MKHNVKNRKPWRQFIALVYAFLLCATIPIAAQNISVKGKITNQVTEDPVPGATVIQRGTKNAVVSDMDGTFTINVPADATLEVHYVGYKETTVAVNGRAQLQITIQEEVEMLDEVVAIGYGTAKKRDLTGSVVSLKLENSPISLLPNANMLDALKGSMPGFDVGVSTTAGGNPSFNIRGQNSLLAGNSPLIVVDGVIFIGSFNELNPSDIASVDILKDASSTAVYGSKAANGVILVTTKQGKSEKPLIKLHAARGVQTYTHRPEMLSPEGYLQMKRDIKILNGSSGADLELENMLTLYEYKAYQEGHTVDWFDEVTRLAPFQDYQMSVSGASGRTNYYVSGGYLDQQGIVYNDEFSRFSVVSKVESKITDWLKLGLNLSVTHKQADGVAADLEKGTINGPYAWKYVQTPGYENVFERYPQGHTTTFSPFWKTLTYDEDRNQNYRSLAYARIDVPWIKGLSYTFNYSLNRWEGHASQFNDERMFMDTMKEGDLIDQTKYLKDANGYRRSVERTNWFLNHLVNYNRTFGNHSIDATLLAERQKQIDRRTEFSSKDFSQAGSSVLGVNKLELGATKNGYTQHSELAQLAYMGRVNYVFKQRYHLSSSIRWDGYSAFAEGNKYGNFKSLAAAWTISEESFIKDNLAFLSHLKLRASFGENGNPSVDPYSTFSTMSSGYYIFGNNTVSTSYANKLANKALKWEKTTALNLGLNFSIFKDVLSGSVDYYNSNTTNLLVSRAIPIMNGFQTVSDNMGKINNWGLEFQLMSNNVSTKNFSWKSGLNFWMNRNKVISLYGLDGNGDGREDDDIANSRFIGKSLGAIYTYTFDGIVQSNDAEYMAIYGGSPGDVKFKDLNNDGKITAEGDRSIIGYEKPNFTMTLSNTFRYKNLELYFLFNYIAGGGKDNYYMANNKYASMPLFAGTANWLNKEYWMPEHPSNTIPRPNYGNALGYAFPQRHDFLRLQDVSLSYHLGDNLLAKTPIAGLRIFAAAKNLLTFSDWEGLDPESATPFAGVSSFPVMKTITFGVEVTF